MPNDSTGNVQKTARIHDKANDTYIDDIEFPLPDLTTKTLKLSPSIVADPAALEDRLRDAGFVAPPEFDFKNLAQSLAAATPDVELIYEANTGWLPDRSGFVTPSGLIGQPNSRILGVSQSNAVIDRTGRRSVEGRLTDWRQTVAEPARGSTTLMTAISVAFGAPLLTLLGRQSFTINLFGPSAAGKSIATLAAASVIGIARPEDLISWKVTNARLEERLAEFNDTVFPIDDLNTLAGTYREKYSRIRDLAYSIAQGNETGRSAAYTVTRGGRQRAWTSIVLTSSEIAVRDMAAKSNTERQQGEARRLIDVPAVFSGLDHIFDAEPDRRPDSNFAAIVEAIGKNHGKVFRQYIKSLIEKGASLPATVSKHVDYFVNYACLASDGSIARDVAQKFGVLYAGGVLGIECGALPWTKMELRTALKKSFVGARELLPDKGVVLRQGLAALKTLRASIPNRTDADLQNGVGFKDQAGEQNRYLIKWGSFTSIFSSAEQRDLAVDWLVTRRRVTLVHHKTDTQRQSEKLREQFTWPDGGRHRSIEFFWPRQKPKKAKIKKKWGGSTKNKKSKKPRDLGK